MRQDSRGTPLDVWPYEHRLIPTQLSVTDLELDGPIPLHSFLKLVSTCKSLKVTTP